MNKKVNIIKALFIFIIIIICYITEYYINKVFDPVNDSYINILILAEIEALIIGVFISANHIKSWRDKGKIRINYIYLFCALIMILLHIPFILRIHALMYFYTNSVLKLLSAAFFWYFTLHAFYKIPTVEDDTKKLIKGE